MARHGLMLMLLLFHSFTDEKEAIGIVQDVPMPPLARAHCRVFVVAARTHTRVLVLQNAYEQDGINLYDQFPALASILQDTAGDGHRSEQDEHKSALQAYQILSPAFNQAAEWLKSRVDPTHCFTHFIVVESEMKSDSRTQDEAAIAASRVTKRLSQLRDEAKSDSLFPFALNAPSTVRHDDGRSVTFSGELHVVTATWRRYFHVVGTNYFSGRVAPSLSPGQAEVFGVIHVDAGGHMGSVRSESDANAAEMIFDVRERWRRSKRQRQMNVALNSSDFYGREYAGFGRLQVQQAVVKLKQSKEKNVEADSLQHPCFSRGHVSVVDGVNMTLEGSGDADACMVLLRSHIATSNANCPPENFCFLGSVPQPQALGSFYASGVLRLAVLSASRVLKHVINKHRMNVDELQLPAPAFLTLRNAARNVCALPYTNIETGAASPSSSASDAPIMERKIELPSALCFDLCYTVVLLEKIGIQEDDERVHFVDRFEKEPILSEHGSIATREHGSPSELVAWLTGTFLYLEALQRKMTFSMESALLAEQLNAGLPLGWNMTLLVFVAACVFLYRATSPVAVSGRDRQGSSGYVHVVNGGTKTKYKDTTQSIQFVDDARD